MSHQASTLLTAIASGDKSGVPELVELVYGDLRRLAQHYMDHETAAHTLQATALVHEAYIKLIDQTRIDPASRSHFFAIGAQAMRRVLVNHARGKQRLKRGGDRQKLILDEALTLSPGSDEDVLALDEALTRLAKIDARQAQIVEMRFFAGMTTAETAAALGLSERTVEREWTGCRAWLRRELAAAERS